MCLFTHGPKIQNDPSLRKLVSCGSQMYQMKEEKSNGIRNAERRKSENTNHNNNHLYLEMSLFCTIVKSMPSSSPSLHRTRRTLQPWSFMAQEEAVQTRYPGTDWLRTSFGIQPQIKIGPTKAPNNQGRFKCSLATAAYHSQRFCPQSTFPPSDTLPQLVHLNKDYCIAAELTQRNLNLIYLLCPSYPAKPIHQEIKIYLG